MVGDITRQGAAGQVVDHRTAQAIVEQAHPCLFKAVELAQINAVGAVGQIQQGQAADVLHDKGDAGQGARSLGVGVLAAHGQVRGQQLDALAVAGKGFTAVGVDGDFQHLPAAGIDVLCQLGEFALQAKHKAPRLTQAFASIFITEGRCRRGAEERLADQPFILPGQIQLGDQLAQPGRRDGAFQFLLLCGVGTADLDLHERQSPPHFLIDVAQRQFTQ
ncbi:hypothetical protein D3C76_514170 [compost metagenome]